MAITLYNTMSGKKERFMPLLPERVSMYHCGPTVYDTAHIGNLRTFVMNDILRRVFEYNRYFVTQAMNITDVDDKTIKRAREEDKKLDEITRHYETLFFADLHALNILTPHKVLRATDHIKDMIELIANLLEKGVAYPSKDGIYLSIGKVMDYGKLARLKLDAHVESRVADDEYEKENPRDFAVWKFELTDDTVAWNAPFGRGRPGWHIECSAMSMRALGETFDIHTGGTDLIFPHHTNEIAQSESATGKQFARYWVHGAFMNVDDAKMAKSKGNFLKLTDLESEMISPLSFRYWLMTAHYRSPVNFSFEAVRAAQSAFIKLAGHVASWPDGGAVDVGYKKRFVDHIADDMDMPGAIALSWALAKDRAVSDAGKKATLIDFDKVFGLGLDVVGRIDNTGGRHADIPAEITALAEAREEARVTKDWKKADALREEIESRGYSVKDTDGGFVILEK